MSNLEQSIWQLKAAITRKEREIESAEFEKAKAENAAAHQGRLIASMQRDIFELEKGLAVLQHADKNVISTT